jgi:hypothetical protein
MTTSAEVYCYEAPMVPRTFGNEVLNAFKTGRGALLTVPPRKPVQLPTNHGIWRIVRISSIKWEGPEKIEAKVAVISPLHMAKGVISARMEVDFRSRGEGVIISLLRSH